MNFKAPIFTIALMMTASVQAMEWQEQKAPKKPSDPSTMKDYASEFGENAAVTREQPVIKERKTNIATCIVAICCCPFLTIEAIADCLCPNRNT